MSEIADLTLDQTDLAKCRLKAFEDGNEFTPYQYSDASGKLQFTICRIDRKDGTKICLPFDSEGNKGYPAGSKARSRSLYNLREIVRKPSGAKIVICEGEKCAIAAAKVFPDDIVTTWTGGGQAIDKSDWKPLEICEVLCIADTDEAGRNAMRKIADKLRKLYCTVRIYQRDGDDHSDIFDWSVGLEYKELRELQAEIELCALDPKAKVGETGASSDGEELTFEPPEPWPDPVDGAKLFSCISKSILKYMYMKPQQAHAVTAWILMSWVHNHPGVYVAPFLNVNGPTLEVGKTRLLSIVGEFCPRPLVCPGLSAPFLFRTIQTYKPTLLIDEIDFKGGNKDDENRELCRMLNSSQTRKTARVGRIDIVQEGNAKKFKSVLFNTWSPKILCGIGGLNPTTLSRCIQIHLERKPVSKEFPYWGDDDSDLSEIKDLVRQIARWIADHGDGIVAGRKKVVFPKTLTDRQKDSWRILFSAADVAGGNCPKLIRAACLYIIETAEQNVSSSELLIEHLRQYCESNPKAFHETTDILVHLNGRPDGNWSDRSRDGMKANHLAKALRPFGIRSTRKWLDSHSRYPHGYLLSDLEPVLRSYAGYPVTNGDKALKTKGKFGNRVGSVEEEI